MKFIHLHIDRKSYRILQFGLPFVIAALLYAAIYISGAKSGEYYIIMNMGKQLVEHAMMSLTLLVGGALLFDYEIRKDKR